MGQPQIHAIFKNAILTSDAYKEQLEHSCFFNAKRKI